MIETLLRIAGIALYMLVFYLLINMGRQNERSFLPYLLFCFGFLLSIGTVRIYSKLAVFNPEIFISLKAIGGSIIGISLSCFVYSVFRIKKLKTLLLVLSIALVAGEIILVPLYLWSGKKLLINVLYALLVFSGTGLFCGAAYWIVKYKMFRERRQKILLIALGVLIINGFFYEILEGILNRAALPFFLQPSIVTIGVFYIVVFISNLRWEHRTLLEQNVILERTIQEKTYELQEAHLQKTRIFSDLARETKTPLSTIQCSLENLVRKNRYSPEIISMKVHIDKLIRDVTNILNIDRIDHGDFLFPDCRPTEISEIINTRAEVFCTRAYEKDISIELDLEKNILVVIDPAAFVIILNNLLDNALKFCKRQGKVSITLKSRKAIAELSVHDSGIGIKKEDQARIFDAYYQSLNDGANGGGIGIGLFLVKKLVEDAGGKINTESIPGKGTSFIIRLPFHNAGSHSPEQACKIQKVFEAGGFAGDEKILRDSAHDETRANVLVIDDNPELLLFLQETISSEFNFYHAANGREALEKLAGIPVPDLVLSDIMMPEMDGMELFEKINGDADRETIPFVFLTARSSDVDMLEAIKLGAVDFIAKPFSAGVLMARIRAIINNRRKQACNLMNAVNKKLVAFVHEQQKLVGRNDNGTGNIHSRLERRYGMSEREIEICRLAADGYRYKEIALKLDLSLNTVETYRKRIFRKCNIQSKDELVRMFKK
ncbi:MAG: response regulator [Spirochaetales bacterium]|nr:response regulator [Spirochaetales bacterium]